jgi:hypothetical protein
MINMIDPQEYEYQDESAPIRAMPFLTPQSQYGSSIVQMTNPEGEIIKMELSLRNQILDDDGKPLPIGAPLLNDLGVSSVVGQVQAIISQTAIMSNFDKREVPMLVLFLADTLAKDLMINRIAYNIQTKAARDKIYYIACASAFICLKRGFEEGDRRFWRGTQQEIRNIVEGANQQGLLQKVFGWGKK